MAKVTDKIIEKKRPPARSKASPTTARKGDITSLKATLGEYPQEMLKEFIKEVKHLDAFDKVSSYELGIIQGNLQVVNPEWDYSTQEITHIYNLLRSQFDVRKAQETKKQEKDALNKETAIKILESDIKSTTNDPRTRASLLQQLGELKGWYENKESEVLIQSNRELFALLNRIFTVEEQEFIGFEMLDKEMIIDNAKEKEIRDSSILSSLEVE